MLKLLYKGRATAAQLRNRIELGCGDIEIHTEVEDTFNIDETMEVIIDSGVDVYVIHAPITTEHTIEGCLKQENRDVLRNTCKLGQLCADKFGHAVDIVIHQELDLFQMEAWGIYNRIKSFTEELLGRYSSIRINFENLSPIISISGKEYQSNSYYDGPYNLARKLREDIKTDRVGVVWDSCHSMNSVSHLRSAWNEGLLDSFTPIEDLRMFLPLLHVIHLSKGREWGLLENHGALFETDPELDELHEILDTLLLIGYDGVLTMETKDDDLENVLNQPALKLQVDNYLKHRRNY